MDEQVKPRRNRRKRVIWLVSLGVLAAVAFVLVARPPRSLLAMVGGEVSKTEAILRVESAMPSFFFKTGSANTEAGDEANHFLMTQIHILRSNEVLTRAVTDPNVSNLPVIRRSSAPITWLRKELRVEQIPDTFLIRVGFDIDDAKESYMVLQAVVRSYMEKVSQFGRATQMVRRKQLQSVETNLKREIELTRDKLRRISREGNHGEPDAGRRGEYRAHLLQESLRISLRIAAEKAQNDRVHATQAEKTTKPSDGPSESMEILEAQRKVLESEHSRSADAEWECRDLTRKLARTQEALDVINDQLREAQMQAESEPVRVTVADPPLQRDAKP